MMTTNPIPAPVAVETANLYGATVEFRNPPTVPVTVGDIVELFNVPVNATFIHHTNGKFRKNAAHHKVTARYNACWVNWDDNLARSFRVFVQPVKKDGSVKIEYNPRTGARRKAEAVEWRYGNLDRPVMVKIVDIKN